MWSPVSANRASALTQTSACAASASSVLGSRTRARRFGPVPGRRAHPVGWRVGSSCRGSGLAVSPRSSPAGPARPRRRGRPPAPGRAGSSLSKTCETWVFTVGSARTRRSAISRFDSPRPTSLRTSTSRSVRSRRAALRSSFDRRQPVRVAVEQPAGDGRREQRVAGGDGPDARPRTRPGVTSLSRNPLAPARSASTTYSSASNVVRMRTRASGAAPSRTMPAGRLDPVEDRHPDVHHDDVGLRGARAASTPACPSAASPTTSMSGSSSRIIRNPVRTSAWSSTSSTRIASCRRPPASDRAAGGACTRKPVGVGPASKSPPYSADPLAHADQAATAVPALSPMSRRPLPPSSVDLDLERARLVGEPDPGPGAARVLERVGERLLDDPVGGQLDAGVERRGARPPSTARPAGRPRGPPRSSSPRRSRPGIGAGRVVAVASPRRVAQDPEHPAHVGRAPRGRSGRSPRAPSAPARAAGRARSGRRRPG